MRQVGVGPGPGSRRRAPVPAFHSPITGMCCDYSGSRGRRGRLETGQEQQFKIQTQGDEARD